MEHSSSCTPCNLCMPPADATRFDMCCAGNYMQHPSGPGPRCVCSSSMDAQNTLQFTQPPKAAARRMMSCHASMQRPTGWRGARLPLLPAQQPPANATQPARIECSAARHCTMLTWCCAASAEMLHVCLHGELLLARNSPELLLLNCREVLAPSVPCV